MHITPRFVTNILISLFCVERKKRVESCCTTFDSDDCYFPEGVSCILFLLFNIDNIIGGCAGEREREIGLRVDYFVYIRK